MPRIRLVRVLPMLMAALLSGLPHNANAVTFVLDAAWIEAGAGSAGDRCLDDMLLHLGAGDTVDIMVPAAKAGQRLRPLVRFTQHRRPAVRHAALIAVRRRLDEILARLDPATWPRLDEILPRLAASPGAGRDREQRYVFLGALTATKPPAVDLELVRLLRDRRITVVDLAHAPSKRRASRRDAWQQFFSAVGVAQLEILPAIESAAPAKHPRGIACSGGRLQVLDHQLK